MYKGRKERNFDWVCWGKSQQSYQMTHLITGSILQIIVIWNYSVGLTCFIQQFYQMTHLITGAISQTIVIWDYSVGLTCFIDWHVFSIKN